MRSFHIPSLSAFLQESLQQKINQKTKPIGALGQLKIALQAGLIQNTLTPVLHHPHIVVFAADHGITEEGVSAYPSEVTYQMVLNFLSGGAAINVFCRQQGIQLLVADAGVKADFSPELPLIHAKVARGTQNFLREPAMTARQAIQAIERGSQITADIYAQGCNIIGFGEMGIGNTASASALMSRLGNLPIEQCTGRGTGLDDEQLTRKTAILAKALATHTTQNAFEALCAFGGFEIAMMCGAMLQAAESQMVVLVDGFIASAAFLVACSLYPTIKEYAVFCHQSGEQGHRRLLEVLGVSPLLNLQMRLGEGTGCALAYPLVEAAVAFLNEMASFESAGIAGKV